MTDKINVGDKVSFAHRTTVRPYIHTVTGTVVDLLPWSPCALALVEREDGLMGRLIDVRALKLIDDLESVEP